MRHRLIERLSAEQNQRVLINTIRDVADEIEIAANEIPNSGGFTMKPYVRLYLTGDSPAVATNVTDESEFVRHFCSAIARLTESVNPPEEEWNPRTEDLLTLYLPQFADIVCKLRGYKAPTVEEQRVLISGSVFIVAESQLRASSEPEKEKATYEPA